MANLLLSQITVQDFTVLVLSLFFTCFSFGFVIHAIFDLFSCFLDYLEIKFLEKKYKNINKNNKPTA